jgi:hypothetical protein
MEGKRMMEARVYLRSWMEGRRWSRTGWRLPSARPVGIGGSPEGVVSGGEGRKEEMKGIL